ncbi:MAG: 16S rRNA (guanine(527)-N(7))-methyltransferase RsmG [Planctomycetota bacterium]
MEISEQSFKEIFLAEVGEWVPERADLLAHHAWRVAEQNKVMNLTRISDPKGMAIRHALDSLSALPILSGTDEVGVQRVLDLGTGPGYPGLALAIAMPELEMVLLDSRQKKVKFLEELVADLGLSQQVRCVWSRFEDWIRPERKSINMVLARAVGRLPRLLEWTTNNYFGPLLLWKGPAFDQELIEAKSIMEQRKLSVVLDLPYELPEDDVKRRLALIDWKVEHEEQE